MLDAYLQRMYLFDQEEIDLISQYLEEKIDADGSLSEIKYLTPVTKHRQKVLQSLRPPCKAVMPSGPKSNWVFPTVIAVKDPDLSSIWGLLRIMKHLFRLRVIRFILEVHALLHLHNQVELLLPLGEMDWQEVLSFP